MTDNYFGIEFPGGTFQVYTPDGWVDICHATTWRGARSLVNKITESSSGYGGLRHPSGGPTYGYVRMIPDDGGDEWRYSHTNGPIPPGFDPDV